MATKRISDEPAYVLYRYDWSETSLILEVFTRTAQTPIRGSWLKTGRLRRNPSVH